MDYTHFEAKTYARAVLNCMSVILPHGRYLSGRLDLAMEQLTAKKDKQDLQKFYDKLVKAGIKEVGNRKDTTAATQMAMKKRPRGPVRRSLW